MGNGNIRPSESEIQNQNLNQNQNPQILQRQMIILNGRPNQNGIRIQQIPLINTNNNNIILGQHPIIMIRGLNQQYPLIMIRGNNPLFRNNMNRIIINNENINQRRRRRNENGFLEPQIGNKRMSIKQIERLGIEIYDKSKHYSTEKCMICLENFQDKCKLRRLDCLHIFHLECIDGWLKEHGNCPIDKILVEV